MIKRKVTSIANMIVHRPYGIRDNATSSDVATTSQYLLYGRWHAYTRDECLIVEEARTCCLELNHVLFACDVCASSASSRLRVRAPPAARASSASEDKGAPRPTPTRRHLPIAHSHTPERRGTIFKMDIDMDIDFDASALPATETTEVPTPSRR